MKYKLTQVQLSKLDSLPIVDTIKDMRVANVLVDAGIVTVLDLLRSDLSAVGVGIIGRKVRRRLQNVGREALEFVGAVPVTD